MINSFNNKVADITGAGSGIGQALAINLANKGCNLALCEIDEAGLTDTLKRLKCFPVSVTTQKLNVADKTAVFNWANQVVLDHGKVNLIFNNAGVALSGTVSALSIDDYDWIMDINFGGTLYGTKAFLPHLESANEGHIINISSVFGLTAQPLMSGYNASKFAVRGFSESLRQDLELTNSNVSVTCVHPGGIKTNIAKSGRMSNSVKETTGINNNESIKEFEKTFITSPDKAAKIILKAVLKNKRRVLIGIDARFYDWIVRVFPAGYQWLFTKIVKWKSKI
jgi:short-subunit dehydrogenase